MSEFNLDEFFLSPLLEGYRDRIIATIQPYLDLTFVPDENLTWWQSKFPGQNYSQSGLPYLPKGVDYPTTPAGDYLHLLAQINFAEVPSLDNFPDRGILQFYVADLELWGCPYPNYGEDFEQNWYRQNSFRLLYFPDPDLDENNLVTDFSFLAEIEKQQDFYPQQCSGIQWGKNYALMPSFDYRFYKTVFHDLKPQEIRTIRAEFEEDYRLLEKSCTNAQIGGYASFAQEDPRDGLNLAHADEPVDTLLLSVSMPENVLLFYIQSSALAQRDFSRVLYTFS